MGHAARGLLVGQPTLRRRIKLGMFAALDQRIGLRFAMPPLTQTETASYIGHHVKLAGRTDTLFSDDAANLIHQVSRGLRTPTRFGPGLPRRDTPKAGPVQVGVLTSRMTTP